MACGVCEAEGGTKKLRYAVTALLLVLFWVGFVSAKDMGTPVVKRPGQPETTEVSPAPAESRPVEKVPFPNPVDANYIIGPGDILGISIWKDEALTKDVVVLPDGIISFPLLGQLKASGKTVAQLKTEIEEKIAQYVSDPVLNIEVKQVNSMLIYVIGRVNQNGGRFPLNTNVTVLQALAMAGGLNPFAERNKIKVFRQEDGKTKFLPFHYDDVIKGKRLEENIELKRGDIIVVP
jgi:polysaccharide export outer membrane protein